MSHTTAPCAVPRSPRIWKTLVLALALSLAAACGPIERDPSGSSGDTGGSGGSIGAGGGGGSGGSGGTGDGGSGGTGDGGSGGTEGTGGTGGSTPPATGEPTLFRPNAPMVLVDTTGEQPGRCGSFETIEGANRRLVVDLDDCTLDDGTPATLVGVVGSVTVRTTSTDTFDVRVGPAGGPAGAIHTVGPLQSATHGFITMLGDGHTLKVEVSGNASADVILEMSAALVPATDGGDYVHLLDRPERWFSANPNDAGCGFRAVWTTLEQVHHASVIRFAEGATGMLGTVHLGPHVWRDTPVTFHMGPAGATGDGLNRWVSTPTDAHFPWTWSSLFLSGASPAQELELRASSDGSPWDVGPEPWVDAVGWLSPARGLVYRPLEVPLEFGPVVTVNEEDVRFETGIPEAVGVVGSLTFDLPQWTTDPSQPPYRWYHVMVASSVDQFPSPLGGCIEDFDWMTAALHQNGRVTTQFISRTDERAGFTMRHYAFVSGLTTQVPERLFEVTARVRIDGVLTRP